MSDGCTRQLNIGFNASCDEILVLLNDTAGCRHLEEEFGFDCSGCNCVDSATTTTASYHRVVTTVTTTKPLTDAQGTAALWTLVSCIVAVIIVVTIALIHKSTANSVVLPQDVERPKSREEVAKDRRNALRKTASEQLKQDFSNTKAQSAFITYSGSEASIDEPKHHQISVEADKADKVTPNNRQNHLQSDSIVASKDDVSGTEKNAVILSTAKHVQTRSSPPKVPPKGKSLRSRTPIEAKLEHKLAIRNSLTPTTDRQLNEHKSSNSQEIKSSTETKNDSLLNRQRHHTPPDMDPAATRKNKKKKKKRRDESGTPNRLNTPNASPDKDSASEDVRV